MKIHMTTRALAAGLLLLTAWGCYQDKEKDKDYTILKKGHAVPEAMSGWLAVPMGQPKEVDDAEKGLKYYRLSGNTMVPESLNGFLAFNATSFKGISGIEVAEPADKPAEAWEMKYNKKIPEGMDGWVGVPPVYPKIERDGPQAAAELFAGMVLPKEMHGWVAVEKEALANMAAQREMKMGTLKDKKPKAE
ncbi:MAG: hypothetical protein M5U26_00880 [Planctomycetota bacterium]|nr:hypothetical protein [Planctomycetota bacterium]